MKISVRLLLYIMVITSFTGFYSCDKKTSSNNVTGMAEFSFNLLDQKSSAKSGSVFDSAIVSYHLVISVEDTYGNPVMNDKTFPLLIFGSGYITDKIEFKAGEYRLTRFMVVNPAGEVVFASPVEGSSLAYLTNDPLPLYFTINPGQVTNIPPEVVVVGDHTPGEFGYASFGMQIINPLDFWTVCYLDNPLIMAPVQFTSARLTISANDGWHYTFFLEPALNRLIIRGGSEFYTFVLEKDGYESQTLQFTASELIAATKEAPLLLKIPWNSQYNILVLQPGPETGKDALISNLDPEKNFGDYKYFETTFLTEPVLTVMRSNRSLISFDMSSLPKSAVIQKVTLRLTYDLPIPFDSTIIIVSPSIPFHRYE